MMRTSATVIEAFRLWSDPDQEWMSEADLIASIKGETVPTKKMMIGTALGRCLEKPDKYRRDRPSESEIASGVAAQMEGHPGSSVFGDFGASYYYRVPVKAGEEWIVYEFGAHVIDPCLEKFNRRGVFEPKMTKQYGNLMVVVKADQIFGADIIENKAKLNGQFDFDKYFASCQWRFLIDVFEGALSLTYNVFMLDEDKEENIGLRGIESFTLYPYEGLHRDCEAIAEQFERYVTMRNLDGLLRERQQLWGVSA